MSKKVIRAGTEQESEFQLRVRVALLVFFALAGGLLYWGRRGRRRRRGNRRRWGARRPSSA